MARKNNGTKADGGDVDIEALARTLGGGTGDGSDDASGDPLDREETVARLKACAARLHKAHTFTPGQLVRWKKGLKNKRTPAYGEPVIVVEVLATPVLDKGEAGAGTPYFREPLTIVAGELDRDGDFVCFHYDGRRFEPYTE